MTRTPLFANPLLLGFEQLEELAERLAKGGADGYPPHNIEQTEHGLRITLAVAGFALEDLAVCLEGNQLTVRGKQREDAGRVYLHRGIAARQFQRSFLLADGIDVKAATLDHGLLNVELERPKPESRVRNVDIRSGSAAQVGKRPERSI